MSASKKLPETRRVGSEKRREVKIPGLMRVEQPKMEQAAVYSCRSCSMDTTRLLEEESDGVVA